MEKEFAPYKEAFALKEIGFDEPCFGYYDASDLEIYKYVVQNNVKNSDFIFGMAAPLYQQAFRWFRENHGLYTNVTRYNDDDEDKFLYYIDNGDIKEEFKTYEEAELACLRKLIEIVKNQTINQ